MDSSLLLVDKSICKDYYCELFIIDMDDHNMREVTSVDRKLAVLLSSLLIGCLVASIKI